VSGEGGGGLAKEPNNENAGTSAVSGEGGGGLAQEPNNENTGTLVMSGPGGGTPAQEPTNGNAVFQHQGMTLDDVERQEAWTPDQLANKVPALQPYNNVKNLLWIKQNTVYSLALDEWDRVAKLLADRVDRMEKRSGDLLNEIYQLVGFFTVFQGVVLTAVTQLTQNNNTHLNCQKVLSFVALTALAWFVTSVGVFHKLRRIQLIDDECSNEDEARRLVVRRAQDLRRMGSEFRFRDIKEKAMIERNKLLGLPGSFWYERFAPVVVTLSLFTGIFIYSYFLILCNRGLAEWM
jgi:hypothetical protein